MEKEPRLENFPVYPTKAETPSVLHYTSGTTGKPKGAQHVHYSLISQYITAKYVLDLKEDDIYWCTADPGWVTGTSYGIIGAWANGVTQCVLDAGFKAESWYRFIEKYRVTVWYSAPTAIRSLMKEGDEIVKKFDLSCLRHLCSVGEPLNAEAVLWSKKVFGLMFHDTFWQTETGSMMVTNYPTMKIKPGSMGKPFPGITATVVDLKTHEPITKAGIVGLIAIKPGWPSMFRTYWKNEEIYKSKFKNGWYICGDRASIDEEGYFWFVGRDDDVINTAGHLVGPFEIESALLEHEAVAESAVVGKPDPVNMEVVKAFIALKPGFQASKDAGARHHELRAQEALGPGHAPGDRVRARAAQDALGQDHAPRAARPGMGRGDRRHLDPGERLRFHQPSNTPTQAQEWYFGQRTCIIAIK